MTTELETPQQHLIQRIPAKRIKHSATAKAKQSKARLPSEIELPTHYPPRLQEELDKCKREHCRLNELSRSHLIRILCDFFYIKVQDPTPTEYAAMAMP